MKCFLNWNAYLSIHASIKMRGLRTGLGGNGDAIHNSDLLTVHNFHQVFESMTNLTNQAFQTTPLQDHKSEKMDMFCGYLECHSMIFYAFLIFSSNFQKTKLWHHWIVRNFSSGRLIYIQILAVRVWVLHTLAHQTNRLQNCHLVACVWDMECAWADGRNEKNQVQKEILKNKSFYQCFFWKEWGNFFCCINLYITWRFLSNTADLAFQKFSSAASAICSSGAVRIMRNSNIPDSP